MQSPKLTIGMATYDDFDGVYFSIQAIRMFHPEVANDIEFLVIDNNPNGSHGKDIKNFCGYARNIKYIPFEEYKSTAIRNKIFENATCPYVLSMDCHVFFEAGSLKKLIDYYSLNSNSQDLLQGPLVYDDLQNISSHFDPVWRSQMYGTWGTDNRAIDKNAEPFEIPMQGLGVFSCKKDSWLGFNNLFKGFGGEEGYIHEKFRKHGHKTLCLPFLRWIHRFARPNGIKYPLLIENKVRNYFIGHIELGMDPMPVINHFKEWMPERELIKLYETTLQEVIASGVFQSNRKL